MKRFATLLFILALLSAPSAFAQDITYGALGGAGLMFFDSYASSGSLSSSSSTTGINLGATAQYPYKDNIVLRGTIAYSKYFPGSDTFPDGSSVDYSLSDFSIEADANYYINDNVYGIGGIGIHMVHYSVDLNYTLLGYSFSGTYDYGDTKYGIQIGAGYKLNDKMSVEAKYVLISNFSHLKASFVYYFGEFSL